VSDRSLFPAHPRQRVPPGLPVAGDTSATRVVHACAGALCIVALVAWGYWPGVHGDWGRDDYFQLALARLIGSPWALFTHDHFPVPGSVFRPLGFASMWLDTALFGARYAPHAVVDLGLHATTALALHSLLLRLRVGALAACACTLLFALHPAALGTALWWSARFDLLATLFVVLGLAGAVAYRDRCGTPALVATLVAILAAMLCKETGLLVVAPVTWLWAREVAHDRAARRPLLRAIALAWLVLAAYFAWRSAVLGTAASALTGPLPVGTAIAKGLLDWMRQMPGYVSFAARLEPWQGGALVVAIVLSGAAMLAMAMSWPPRTRVRDSHAAIDAAVCGLCLFVLPALLQAPVAALNAAPLAGAQSAVEAAMQSRLYYISLAGLALLAAALAECCRRNRVAHAVLMVAIAVAVSGLAAASHRAADEFARRSLAISAPAHAAVAAVAALDVPGGNCHVVFTGVDPPPEWGLFVSMDSVVKAMSPGLGRVAHCWFHADYPTWFHLLAAPAVEADALPWRPLAQDGEPVPWRTLGGLVIAYVERMPAARSPAVRVLRYRDGRFEPLPADAPIRADAQWQ
jgi:hypothetical protein